MDLDTAFTYQRPSAEAVADIEAVRDAARDLATTVDELAPASREKSLALTKIEEAMMWANAAIVRHQE